MHFGNATDSGISGNFCDKFLYHLPLFPNFRECWLKVKRPVKPPGEPVVCRLKFRGHLHNVTFDLSLVQRARSLESR